MNDAKLIQEFCNGNTQVFNQLVERWQPRIYRLAFRYFNSHDEAREITQKTFIRVYKKLSSLDDYAAFPAWIYRIAQNLCRDEAKRAGRRRSQPMDSLHQYPEEPSVAGNPGQPLEQKELGRILQQALQQLPPEQRMVVIMKEYEELKFREIAEVLDLPESTVKSRVYYGLRSLRGIFDQWNINKESLYYE